MLSQESITASQLTTLEHYICPQETLSNLKGKVNLNERLHRENEREGNLLMDMLILMSPKKSDKD